MNCRNRPVSLRSRLSVAGADAGTTALSSSGSCTAAVAALPQKILSSDATTTGLAPNIFFPRLCCAFALDAMCFFKTSPGNMYSTAPEILIHRRHGACRSGRASDPAILVFRARSGLQICNSLLLVSERAPSSIVRKSRQQCIYMHKDERRHEETL